MASQAEDILGSFRSHLEEMIAGLPDDPQLRVDWIVAALADTWEKVGAPEPETPKVRERNYPAEEGRGAGKITAQDRTARAKMNRRTESFRAMAEHSPDIILRLDPDMQVIYVNPTLVRLIGKSQEQLVGHAVRQMYSYEGIEKHIEVLSRLFERGAEGRIEQQYETVEGPRWFDLRVAPEHGPDGRVETLLLVGRDITGIKTIEAALHRSEARLQAAVDQAGLTVFEQDKDLRYTWVYPDRPMLGQPSLTGRRDEDLFTTESADLLTEVKREVLSLGEGAQRELWLEARDGTAWYDLIFDPIRNEAGQVTGLIGVAEDISGRKEAERDLAYRAFVLDQIHDAVVAVDADACITSWNRAAEGLYGWKAGEVTGRPLEEVIQTVYMNDGDRQRAEKARREGQPYEARVIQRNRAGDGLWIEARGAALRALDGTQVGYVTANRDVTAAHLIEEENARQRGLLESQRVLLRAIILTDPSGLAVISGTDMTIRMVNDSFRAILPDPDSDPVGKTWNDILPVDEGFDVQEVLQTVLADEASVTLDRMVWRSPQGQPRTFTIHTRPLDWEGEQAVLAAIWETTEFEQALDEAQRRATEAEEGRRILDALLEYLPEGIVIASGAPDLRVTHISKYNAGLGLYSRTVGENLAGDMAPIREVYRPDGVTLVAPAEFPLNRAALAGEVIENEEVLGYRDGAVMHLSINAGPIRDAEGNLSGAVSAIRDITEGKRVEMHQQFLNELSRGLVALRSPAEVIEGIAHRVGRYLGLDRCYLVREQIASKERVVAADFFNDLPSLAGSYGMETLPEAVRGRYLQGRDVVIADTRLDPLTKDAFNRAYQPLQIGALIGVPWQDRDGVWTGTLIAASRSPRIWREDEIGLLHSVADLARLALENASLFENLREFRYRFKVALQSAPITVFTLDRDLSVTWAFNSGSRYRPEQLLNESGGSKGDLPNGSLVDMLKRVLVNGETAQQELSLELDGALSFFDITVESLFGMDGELAGLTCVAVEVTEQRMMEAEAMRNLAHIEVQRRLIQERELERTRIARDLHDGPLQDLIATNFGLVDAMRVDTKAERLVKMHDIQAALHRQIQELRRFCNELRPPVLGPFGLSKTIRSHIESFQVRYPELNIFLDLDPDELQLPEDMRMNLFRVYQELMNNVARHSRATQVSVRLYLEENQVTLEVEDNGVGFESPENWVELARKGHLGLVGMRERVEMAGGSMDVQSRLDKGTIVRISVPR